MFWKEGSASHARTACHAGAAQTCVCAFVHVSVCVCDNTSAAREEERSVHTLAWFRPVLMLSVLSCAPDELVAVTLLHECYE